MATERAPVVPLSSVTSLAALPRHELDHLLAAKEQAYLEAAQQAAPLSWQLQLAREIVAIRMARKVGEGATMEVGALTEVVTQEMAKTGFMGQVILDGLRGKINDVWIERVERVVDRGLEAQDLIHHVTAGAIVERVEGFKAPSSSIRKRDLVYGVAFDKMPRKLGDGGR